MRTSARPTDDAASRPMPVKRAATTTSMIDVLDRVLDKGIVVDAWIRVSLVGVNLITAEARFVVASIETYLRYAHVNTRTRPFLNS